MISLPSETKELTQQDFTVYHIGLLILYFLKPIDLSKQHTTTHKSHTRYCKHQKSSNGTKTVPELTKQTSKTCLAFGPIF